MSKMSVHKYMVVSLCLLCVGCVSVSGAPVRSAGRAVAAQPAPVLVEESAPKAFVAPSDAVAPIISVAPNASVGEVEQPAPLSDEVLAALPTLILDEFSINKDSALGPVLRALARIADVNIVFGESVEAQGPFRFHLNNPTPWNEVLKSILDVHHLACEVHGQIITIMTLDDMQQRYSLEKHKNDQLELKLQREAQSPLELNVIQVKYVKASALVEPLNQLLQQSSGDTGKARGSISADEVTNSIIVNASEADLRKMKDLVDIIDRKTQQVRIEASLVEVSSELAQELGVKWSLSSNSDLTSSYETRSDASVSPMSMDEDGVFTLSDATYHSMQGMIDTSSGAIDYGIISKNFAVGMNLSALEEDGKLKILSRPSLTTMDNRKAVIKSGSEVPYTTEDEDGRSVVEYKEAVLSLTVCPQIVDDIAIFLDITITKDEPDFSQAVDGNPMLLKKYVETRMMVLDGQTAVIGGLTKSSRYNKDFGVPVLRNIPVIGRLFSSKSKSDNEEELLIFLTPRIIPNTALDNSDLIKKWMKNHYDDQDEISITSELMGDVHLQSGSVAP